MVLKLDFCRTFNVGAGGGDGYDQRRTLRFHHAAVRHKRRSWGICVDVVESGPLMTMIILGTAGIASFEPHVFVGAVLPFLVGFALGNLDPELREFFSKAVQTLIPFFAFALGNTIDLTVIAQTGLLGILLGVAVIIVTGIPLIIADKLIGGGDGTAGIAASSSAGAAVATPVLIAEMVPAFKPMAPAATSLVATAVIVTSILVPILTSIWSRKVKARAAKIEILGTVK